MAITGFRPPTSSEVNNYRAQSNIPDTASQATLDNGEVVFYDAPTVMQLYPQYVSMFDDQKRMFLATMPGGVILRVPLQPMIVPDSTSSPSNPISLTTVAPVINLATLVDISQKTIDRTYLKNSMQPIPGAVVTFMNTSPTITINVVLNATMGITFLPSSFTLNPDSEQDVQVSFDSSTINQLQEGLSTIATTINLTSNTPIIREINLGPVDPPPPPIIEILPPPPPPPASTGGSGPTTQSNTPIDVGTPWIPILPPQFAPIEPESQGAAPFTPPPIPIPYNPPIQDIPPESAPPPFIPLPFNLAPDTPIVSDQPGSPPVPTILPAPSPTDGGGASITDNGSDNTGGSFLRRFMNFFAE